MLPLHHKTITLESTPLSHFTGKQIWLKMECYQPVGSFKIRGIGRLCQYYVAQGKKQLVSSSGGNAGLATAYAGRKLGVEVTVFLPTTSKQIYLDAIAAEGARIEIKGDAWDEANAAALAYVEKTGGAYIPPFDHPLIWAGNSTMIDEVAEIGIKPDAVVASVGGGGLACGILSGMERQGWDDVPLITVETEGAASFTTSVKTNEWVTLAKIDSIATTLGAKRVAKTLFEWRNKHVIFPSTVSDRSAVLACQSFLNDHRVLVEPASGAALSVIYEKNEKIMQYKSILVIVCGGVGISPALLTEYLGK